MSLEEYWAKRDFNRTLEPRGEVKTEDGKRFVVQEHHARSLHWDLRLERDGVLKSWAVPKGLPEVKGVRRLAVQTEDHPVEYADFSGIIHQGEYGGGEVAIWDSGDYEAEKWREDGIIVHFNGGRIKGRFCLIRLKGQRKNWLLFRCDGYEGKS